jgi:branched-chain amino acid transport system substrate-binding protein
VKKGLFNIAALLLAVALLSGSLAGCSKTSTTTTNSATVSTTVKEQVVTIGVDAPLTGGAAAWGLSDQYGVTLAAEDFNNAGGLTIGDTHYTFKVEALDDKYDTAATTSNLRQMIFSDNIKYVFSFQTEGTLALVQTFTDNKVLNFTVVNDDNVIKQPAAAYSYRTYMGFSMQAEKYINWLKANYPDKKNFLVVTTQDTNGVVTEAYTGKYAKAAGFNYLKAVFFDPATTDFTPFMTGALAQKPDIILTIGVGPGQVALIAKTAYDMGYRGLQTTGIVGAADLVDISGKPAIEGMVTLNMPLISGVVTDAILGLPARQDAKWGAHYCCTWDFYSQAMILFQAMQKAKSVDSVKVKAILDDYSQSYDYAALVGGKATFGSTPSMTVFGPDGGHQILNAFPVTIIKDGKDTKGAVINP